MSGHRLGGLVDVPAGEYASYLRARSGLPGPRANLELADEFTSIAHRATILAFASAEDEYLRFCGTQAIGRLVVDDPDDPSLTTLLRVRATDCSWRVREAAARALHVVGDADRTLLATVVTAWSADPDLYVRRAALAAICEPRLLTSAVTRTAALQACIAATEALARLPRTERGGVGARSLRQALGYCWSVAIAADPAPAVPVFRRLQAEDDPDLRWIVASNLKKARLRPQLRLLLPGDTVWSPGR